ncbi:SRPBCC family protein [Neptunicella sp. SCSIO 80796]|uniref:SRPBCC family protein n=1 Tax=Neptunicella plasticusilytica TaxID=3117012 RepID=UPI003A4E1A45
MYQTRLSVKFNAPVSALYEAWYKPELLLQWFAPGEMLVAQAMSNFAEGGKFRIVMQEPTGEQNIVMGEYLQIETNKKLVFSWQWLGSEDVSKVELLFGAVNDNTSQLELTHSEFPNQQVCNDHQDGWVGCLEKLSLLTL